MNKVIAGYGEFMVKHTVSNCANRDEITSSLKDNLKRFPQIVDTYGGTEGNVLINLSSLNVITRYASSFKESGKCSQNALNEFNRFGVDTSFISFNNHHLGEYYFLDNKDLKRNEKTKFYREGSSINHWDLKDFDFDAFFKDVYIFHLSGISLSLDKGKEGNAWKNAFSFVKEAKKRGILVSFDFNYRPSMWEDKIKKNCKSSLSDIKEKAKDGFKNVIEDVLKYVDIFLLNSLDLNTFLDYKPFIDDYSSTTLLNKKQLSDIQKWFFEKYENSKMLVIRNREKPSNEFNWFKSYILTKNKIVTSTHRILFPVIESIGGGDAFDAGILYGLLKNGFNNLSKTLHFANDLFVLKHQVKGDYFNANGDNLNSLLKTLKYHRDNTNILLTVDKIDQEFKTMKNDLSYFANVTITNKVVDSLKGYDILIGKRLSEKQLETNDRLKAIFAYKTGVDDFPLEMMDKQNISLFNSHIDASIIAKYAFALATTLSCRIAEFDKKMRKGIWYDYSRPYWKSIEDMRIGLLGFGNIGRKINDLLVRNNIETYTIKRHDDIKMYEKINVTYKNKEILSLKDLINASDMIIVSLPKTKETDNMFNEHTFSLMKGKYLVNVGRGNCIDEKALYDALKNNILYGAAIDTWKHKAKENGVYPCSDTIPLWQLDNIIMSPHQAMKIDIGHKRYVLDSTENVISHLLTGYERDKVNLKKGY
ncbi:MAG: PfkB family carbohydrate kinase [Erysipelotrichaceae bacterium]|nr:PfkB family carbohydrate kinase [Erysipelotrichaceae bacterium]